MGGVALLARDLGHAVKGSDARSYPPMSTELAAQGIPVCEGYHRNDLVPAPDLVIIGNALSRGNECVEHVLNERLAYTSGPQWLAEMVLRDRQVFAVSGTHGKTTTSALLAWIMESAGRLPGFLIGGVAENFQRSARLGGSSLFVVEADEYDTAFFDKRSKFVHYRPGTLIITNIEYDHADIFSDLADIRRQFHHLVRTVPAQGKLLVKGDDEEIAKVLAMGCWTPVDTFGAAGGDWTVQPIRPDYSAFAVRRRGLPSGEIDWALIGRHNAENALAAVAAAAQAGIEPEFACALATGFKSTRRRLQRLASVNGVTVYDDFAHHPTAIRATLAALREHVGAERIIALVELRSNSMKLGVHKNDLGPALSAADEVFIFRPHGLGWDIDASVAMLGEKCQVLDTVGEIIAATHASARNGDHVVIMSNGGFEDIQRRLLERFGQ